jgi:hypothetical protein
LGLLFSHWINNFCKKETASSKTSYKLSLCQTDKLKQCITTGLGITEMCVKSDGQSSFFLCGSLMTFAPRKRTASGTGIKCNNNTSGKNFLTSASTKASGENSKEGSL